MQSKVARRIFFLFILCALIPLSSLAYLSFRQVTKELYLQADIRLHQASKASGMSILERLYSLESDLEIIASNLQKGKKVFHESSSDKIRDSFKNRFKGLVLMTGRGQIYSLFGKNTSSSSIEQKMKQNIFTRARHCLQPVLVQISLPAIFMVKALGTTQSSQAFLLGEIDPEYLWGEEVFISNDRAYGARSVRQYAFLFISRILPIARDKKCCAKKSFIWAIYLDA